MTLPRSHTSSESLFDRVLGTGEFGQRLVKAAVLTGAAAGGERRLACFTGGQTQERQRRPTPVGTLSRAVGFPPSRRIDVSSPPDGSASRGGRARRRVRAHQS